MAQQPNNVNTRPEITTRLSEQGFAALSRILSGRTVRKGQVFVKAGQKNNGEYIVAEGFCRSFLHNPAGEEITISFFKPGDVLPPHITRTREQISIISLQALTEVELVLFDATAFLKLMISNMEIRDFGNSILKDELMRKTDKEISLVSLDARERLLLFRKDFAILENLVPHSMIASYIGVTNVSLSRLRSSLARA
jgi:CRP-like cAMP-binding protein